MIFLLLNRISNEENRNSSVIRALTGKGPSFVIPAANVSIHARRRNSAIEFNFGTIQFLSSKGTPMLILIFPRTSDALGGSSNFGAFQVA
jgi:hypothetical protein